MKKQYIKTGMFIDGKKYFFKFLNWYGQLYKDGNKLGKRKNKFIWNRRDEIVCQRLLDIEHRGNEAFLTSDELYIILEEKARKDIILSKNAGISKVW